MLTQVDDIPTIVDRGYGCIEVKPTPIRACIGCEATTFTNSMTGRVVHVVKASDRRAANLPPMNDDMMLTAAIWLARGVSLDSAGVPTPPPGFTWTRDEPGKYVAWHKLDTRDPLPAALSTTGYRLLQFIETRGFNGDPIYHHKHGDFTWNLAEAQAHILENLARTYPILWAQKVTE